MIGVMVVDDNHIFRQLVVDLLREFPSVDIYEAASGREALEKFDRYMPDAIFIDLELGDENGFNVIRKIRAMNPNVIITILTSFDLPEYKEAATRYRVNHFLTKGISTHGDISAVMNSILAKWGPQGQLPV
ncbi:MAG TPA: response regulator transcription factor [Thermodesulfobacteriota bacterium]|nr:response regulator transcription factor [Thermodesulfobacteriota bacterium]